MSKRKAAPAGQPCRRSKRVAQRGPQEPETQPDFQNPGSAFISLSKSQTTTSLAASSAATASPGGPRDQDTSTSVGQLSAVVGTAAARKLFAIPELLTEILQYLDLASLATALRTNRLFNREGTTAPLVKPIWFLAPISDVPNQYEVDLVRQTLRQITSPATGENKHGRDLVSSYQINPVLKTRREYDFDEDIALPLERLLSLEGHTDLDLPYQSIDTSKWIKISDMQLTKPAIKEVQFNYAPEDDDADKVNLEIVNPNGITVGDIIDAVKARGDAPDERFLTARLWHRDVLLLKRTEVEELESMVED